MSAVDWVLWTPEEVHVGDVISADAGGMPTYKVVAIDSGEAVLEDEHHAALRARLDRFPWKVARAA